MMHATILAPPELDELCADNHITIEGSTEQAFTVDNLCKQTRHLLLQIKEKP